MIDRYEVIGVAGAGAMGRVYTARDPSLGRKVAIKVITLRGEEELDARYRRRLVREARALAQLSHPNVVTVYAAGEYGADVFIAMEYLAGGTLRTWRQRQPRTVAQIVGIYVQAGQGLAAAHAVGIVHRDFKPENVLVDDHGRPRVADFGLAREGQVDPSLPVDAGSGESGPTIELGPALTNTGEMVGTPAYMAPEQFRGQPADSQSDQFAFCVALYEALFDERPFPGRTPAAIAESVLAGVAPTLPATPKIPAVLGRAIARGLALRAEDRFESMPDLLAAIRAPTPRRWVALGAVGVAALAAVGWVAARPAGTPASPCGDDHGLERVWSPRIRADLDAALPGAADRAFAELDAYASAWTRSREDACVPAPDDPAAARARIRCLDRRLAALDTAVQLLPSQDPTRVAKIVSSLAPIEDCEAPDELATADVEAMPRIEAVRIELARAAVQREAGATDAAIALVEGVKPLANELGHPPLLAGLYLEEGAVLASARQADAAEEALRRAYFTASRAGLDGLAASAAIRLVRVVGESLRRFDEGLEWAEHARAHLERLPAGRSGRNRAGLHGSIGWLHSQRGEFRDAAQAYERALAIRDEIDGPPEDRTYDLVGLGQAHSRLGDTDTALAYLQRALAIDEAAKGPNHPDVGSDAQGIGAVLLRRGELDAALEHLERALRIRETNRGSHHPAVATVLETIAIVYVQQGKFEAALERLRRSAEILRGALGPDHPQLARTYTNIGSALLKHGDVAEAVEHLERAVAIREASVGPDHVSVSIDLHNIGLALTQSGKPGQALPRLHRALEIRIKALGPDHADVAVAQQTIGWAAFRAGRADEARTWHDRAIAVFEAHPTANLPDLAGALTTRAAIRVAAGDTAGSVADLQRAVKLLEEGPKHPRGLAQTRFALAQVLWVVGQRRRGRALAASALDEYRASPNPAPEVTSMIETWARTPRHSGEILGVGI